MPIRKGKLHKPCKKCGEMYEPTTRYPGLCNKCNPKSDNWLNRLARLQKARTTTQKPLQSKKRGKHT